MIRFGFTNLRFERTNPKDRFDLLVGVIADLALEVENRLLYSEPDFPVVELAAQLEAWCAEGLRSGEEFEVASLAPASGRGIMPSVVDDTIATGVPAASRGATTVYYEAGNNISVVVNAEGKVVTVSYGDLRP